MGLLTATATVAAVAVVPGVTARPVLAARAAQAGPVVRVDTVGRDPRAWLLSLAERLRTTAADGTAGATGADSCLHVHRLAPTEHGTLLVDSLRWITPAGGVVMQTQATVSTRMVGSPASDAQFDDLVSGLPAPVVTRYEPGALVSPVGDPVPADAHLMANRIAVRTAAMLPADPQDEQGTQGMRDVLVVAVLADLAGIRFLGPSQRAAVLRVLAGLPTLTTAAADAGVAGRGAVAFRVAAGPAAAMVVVDAGSGQLLRYQTGTGAGRVVLWFGASRCGCPQPEPGSSTLPRFWPPVLIQPADTAAHGGSAPQLRCPAGNSRVLFFPAQATVSTEAAR